MSEITYIDIATEDGTILRLLASAIAGWTINEADGGTHELEVEFRSRDVHDALQKIKESSTRLKRPQGQLAYPHAKRDDNPDA